MLKRLTLWNGGSTYEKLDLKKKKTHIWIHSRQASSQRKMGGSDRTCFRQQVSLSGHLRYAIEMAARHVCHGC